ncbi:NlpC/P60 family protein [Marininema mesophilum]|uniref:NlpC/P60 family protein n=1 Tax=Marininema mesophilum TaxID=1048340 RepID=A0A1H2UEQ8_9BACL|nr:C40 family peptidase [Marininema mesophilum]SDW54398.1 NlpC/P60 family protein [Marininema mesophilum]
MRKKNWIRKVVAIATALVLAGSVVPFSAPVSAKADTSQAPSTKGASFGAKVIATGDKYLGTPYKWGAKVGDTDTFDCSSFTKYVYGKNGVELPRGARKQGEEGKKVTRANLQKGDLVFFKLKRTNGKIGHVGIYAGDGKVLHTWGRGGVRYDKMTNAWLDWGFLYGTRVTPK